MPEPIDSLPRETGPADVTGPISPATESTSGSNDSLLIGKWAESYAIGKWRVFPLHNPVAGGCSCGKSACSKIGKHPRIKEQQNAATTDVEIVKKQWQVWPSANIGMLLEGLVVLDVDPRNGGFESLQALEAEYAALERRAVQRSGSGGLHFLMSPGNAKLTKVRGFRPGLDLSRILTRMGRRWRGPTIWKILRR